MISNLLEQAKEKYEKHKYVKIGDLLILLPIIIYIIYVYVYAVNLPRQDDYDAILNWLIKYKNGTVSDKVSLLFAQHNEHRLFFSHVTYAIYHYFFGSINLRHIILFNNVLLLLIFAIIVHFIQKVTPKYWSLASFVTSLSLFDLNNFENADFAMAGTQNYGVVLLFLSSIYFFSRDRKWDIIPATIFQAVCIFSSGNGLIGAFFIVLFNVFNKKKINALISLSILLVCTPLYFYHYERGSPGTGAFELLNIITFFLHMAGAHFSYVLGAGIGGLLLAILLTTLPIGKKLSVKYNALPLLITLGFVLASMATTAIFRSRISIEVSYASRYFIYPHLLTSIVFLFMLVNLEGKKIKIPIVFVSICFLLVAYKNNAKDGVNGFKGFLEILKYTDYYYPDKGRAKGLAEEACRQNIYCIEQHRADK